MVIGFLGMSMRTVNYGVSALAYSQIITIDSCAKSAGLNPEYIVFSLNDFIAIEQIRKELNIENIKVVDAVQFRHGFGGLRRFRKNIRNCDIIFDITQGDSFSDIYGAKRFLNQALGKIITLQLKKPLILSPQTIGPFYNKLFELLAKSIMCKSKLIFVRDDLSQKYAYSLTKRKDIVLTSDLAMNLPYQKETIKSLNNKMKIGLNISALLWNEDNNNAKFDMQFSYQELMNELIVELIKREYNIYLIAHVYTDDLNSEYSICKQLKEKYETIELTRQFTSPMEAKGFMAGLDIFIGARMHATIGAFSTGIPVIPISYSRKFEGLYNSIDYPYCINCREFSMKDALEIILSDIDNYDFLRNKAEKSFKIAKDRNMEFGLNVVKVLKELN